MKTLFASLQGKHLQIIGSHGGKTVGRLFNVQADYASLYTGQDEIIHYVYSKILPAATTMTEVPQDTPVQDMSFPATFHNLLFGLVRKMVKIQSEDGMLKGVLIEVTPDVISIIDDMKMIHISVHQIESIAQVFKRTAASPAGKQNGSDHDDKLEDKNEHPSADDDEYPDEDQDEIENEEDDDEEDDDQKKDDDVRIGQ